MAEETKCMVAGCRKRLHAKGYCRSHYNQVWRKGQIVSEEEARQAAEKMIPLDDNDRIRALERELHHYEMMYRNVSGVEGRLKWRREIAEVKKEFVRLGIAPPVPDSARSLGAG